MAKKSSRIDHKLAPPGWGRYLIALGIIGLVWWIYANSGFGITRLLNRITASAGTVIVVLSFILGPISWKFMPNLDPSEYRKFFGMAGFGLLALHGMLSLSFSSPYIFNYQNAIPLVAGVTSLALFSILAATSSDIVFSGLGYEKWKKIQRLGYIALAIALAHFFLVGTGAFANTLLGQAVIALTSAAIIARIYFVIEGGKKK